MLQLPESGKSIAILDRCRFHEKQRTKKDTAGGIIYQYGVLECLQEADSVLQKNGKDRFFVPYNLEMKGARFAGEMPVPLTPKQVDSLCKALQVDKLIVLEAYKADYKIAYWKVKTFEHITNLYGGIEARERTDFEYYADFTIKLTWSFYDGGSGRETGRISQEHKVKHELERHFTGAYSPGDKEMRQMVGRVMGKRITEACFSTNKKIYRIYYTGDEPAMQRGAEFARDDNWKAALNEWRPLAESTRKVSGKACYNMAIAAERLENYDLALQWLTKAEAKKIPADPEWRKELQRLSEYKK